MTPGRATATPLPSAVVAALRCSVCGAPFVDGGHALRCATGHSFDVARQGYVNLLHAKVAAGTADTADMVAARAEFLAAGFYAPLADALANAVRDSCGSAELLLDAGAGTGYYTAAVLDAVAETAPGVHALALDVSAAASRRAARAHERIGAAVWNLWEPWPVASGVADAVVNVFAPRNPGEFHRVLRPGGTLVVAAPEPGHLGQLAERVGLLAVDEDKSQRLDTALDGRFALAARVRCGGEVALSAAHARRAVLMGPNAHHVDRGGLGERLGALDEELGGSGTIEVTTSFAVSTYRRL